MSEISQHFMVTALDDGTTIHGNLATDGKAISQSWNGAAAIPNWTDSTKQPTIYIALYSGATKKVPSSYKWYYNGKEIKFDGTTNKSIEPSQSEEGYATGVANKFLKTTYDMGTSSAHFYVPALKIIANLASDANTDIDIISISGEIEESGAQIPFSAQREIRISKINATSFVGVVEFVGGIADITEKDQVLTMFGTLYDGNGSPVEDTYSTNWYLNSEATPTVGQDIVKDGTTYANAYNLSEGSVVDYATIRCDFVMDGAVKFSAYVGVDDMQDSELMYITSDGATGKAATMHSGQSVALTFWVGTRESNEVLGGATPAYDTFKVKLLDGAGSVITGNKGSLPSDSGSGMRPLVQSGGKANLTLTYADVANQNIGKKCITGFVYAYSRQVNNNS